MTLCPSGGRRRLPLYRCGRASEVAVLVPSALEAYGPPVPRPILRLRPTRPSEHCGQRAPHRRRRTRGDDFIIAVSGKLVASGLIHKAGRFLRVDPSLRGVTSESAARELTRRELEILRLVAEGHSNSQLTKMLWVTEQTVKVPPLEHLPKT